VPAVDLLFTGGSIGVAPDGSGTAKPPSHVAVSSGRIVAVGGSEVGELADPGTRIVDVAGGLLVPGFQDAHVHPVQGGLERLSCDLSHLETVGQYVDMVRAYAGSRPEQLWVTGAGWQLAAFPRGLPRREALDAAVPDRPVVLLNRDHHGAWVNSTALRLAGVTASTPDPADGRIERDPDGSATGMLHEGAMDLVSRLVPEPTRLEQIEALLEAQRYLHSLGITAWQDAILGTYANITDASAAYAACADDQTLTARVVGALWWDHTRGLEQVSELVERRQRWTRDRFRPTSVKIMQDGIVESFTAGMLSPYLDGCGHPTDNSGQSRVEPKALCEAVTALDGVGFQVHVHAIGDRAVRESLDAFEAGIAANGRRDARHHIAHIQVIHPRDIPRFAELGVAANMQPLWASHEDQMDDLTLPFLSTERAGWQYPFASLVRSGARLAAGSDWPVSSPNPLWGMHVAVNRQLPPPAGEVRRAFLPEQVLDVGTALAAYTAGSAYVNSLDDTGQIRVGALADLVVLDRDIRLCHSDAIGETQVLATYVDGVEVFAR
jgi:predicted amidohydrolase YtcJ